MKMFEYRRCLTFPITYGHIKSLFTMRTAARPSCDSSAFTKKLMKSKLLILSAILTSSLGYSNLILDHRLPSLDSIIAIDDNAEIPKGKPLLIENWATWCGPCIRSFPHLAEILPIVESSGIETLALTNEKEKAVRKFLNKKPDVVPMPVFVDEENSVRGSLRIGAIPMTLLVRPDSTIYWRGHPMSLTRRLIELFSKSLEDPDNLVAGRIHKDLIVDFDLRVIGKRESPLGYRDRPFIEALFTEQEMEGYDYFAVFTWGKLPLGGRFDGSRSLPLVERFIGSLPEGSIKVVSIIDDYNKEKSLRHYDKNEFMFDIREPPSDLYFRAIGRGNAFMFDKTGLVVWSGKSRLLSPSLLTYLEETAKDG